jgi:hypothetical protein
MNTMQPIQAFTKFILLISLSVWISARGGGNGSSTFTLGVWLN